MDQLIKNVEQWSKDKGLNKGNSHVQHTKFSEESGEIAHALCRHDREKLEDGIGDVMVTLIILAQQNDMTIEQCLNTAWNEIKDRTGEINSDGSFVKSQDLWKKDILYRVKTVIGKWKELENG